MRGLALATASLAFAWFLPTTAAAQFWGVDYGAARPGAYIPYDGTGFSHRYNYGVSGPFSPNYGALNGPYAGNYSRYLDTMVRLDREERAARFEGNLMWFDRLPRVVSSAPDREPLLGRRLFRR